MEQGVWANLSDCEKRLRYTFKTVASGTREQDSSAGADPPRQGMTEDMLSCGRCSLHLHLEGGGLGGGGDGGGGLVGAAQSKTISRGVLCRKRVFKSKLNVICTAK